MKGLVRWAVRAIALPPLCVLALVPSTSTHAHAVTSVDLDLYFGKVPGGWVICGAGKAHTMPVLLGEWRLGVYGERSDGTTFDASPPPATGQEIRLCTNVTKNGTDHGNFNATFSYVGVGDIPDGHVVGGGAWSLYHDDIDYEAGSY